MLQWSRYTALIYAVGLAIGEAAINWGHWQYAPLWIVDYLCVALLLAGFWTTRNGKSNAILISGWSFTSAVFYMAFFINLDPENPARAKPEEMPLLYLIGFMLLLTVLGVITSALAYREESSV